MMNLLKKALRPGATALVAMMLLGSFAPAVRAISSLVDPNSAVFVCPSFVVCTNPYTPTITALSADGQSTATIAAHVVDTFGQSLSGETVSLTSSGVVLPSQTKQTDGSGYVSFTVTAPLSTFGTAVFHLTDETDAQNPVPLVNTISLDFKDVSSTGTVVSFPQAVAFVDGFSSVTADIQAKDLGDGPLSNATVTITDRLPNNSLQTVGSAVTDNNGVASISFPSFAVGAHALTVSIDGVIVGGGLQFVEFYPTPTVTITPASALADGVTPITETVVLYGLDGNELPSGMINGTVSAPNSGALNAPNINNVAYQTGGTSFVFTSSVAQQAQVTLQFGQTAIPIDANGTTVASLDFVAPSATPDPSKSDIGVSPTSVPANGVAQSVVNVSVYDTDNQPMASQTVTLTPVSNPAAGLSFPTTATTDNLGTALFPITSTEVTQEAFTVSVGNVVIGTTAMIDFTAPIADQNSDVVVAPTSVPADSVSTATVKVALTDTGFVAIPNQQIDVSYDLGGATVHYYATTGLDGVATVDIASGVVGTATLNIVANGVLLNAHPTVDFTPAPIDFNGSTVTVSPATLPGDNTTQATVTATVVDTTGQPVVGQSVVFDMTIGAYHVYAVGQHVTDAAGIATATFTYGGAGHATFTASANGQVFAQMPVATFIGSAAPTSPYSTVTAAPAMVPADGTTPVTVKVHAGNTSFLPMVNQFVTLTPDVNAPAGLDINASNGGWTDVNGDVIFTVTSPNGGDATFTATVDNGLVPVILTQTATATFVGLQPPVTVDLATSTVDAQPNSVPADGVTTSLVTVTVIDANTGVGAAGQIVSLAEVSGLSGVTISANNAGVTDANGMVTFTVIGTTIGQADLAATVNGVTLNKAALTFTQIPPNAAQSKMSVYPTSLMPNSGNPAVVTVALVDQFGNAVANYPVDLVLTNVPAGMTVTASPALSALSDAQGAATFTLTADTVGSFDIAVSANGLMIGSSVTINVQTMHQGHSDMTVSPATLPADGTSTAILTVTARDAQGVAIVGQQIVLSGGGLGVTVVGNGVTDQSGVALYMISSTNAGTVVFSAKMGSVLFSQTATINFTSTGNSGQIGGGSSGGSSGGGGNFSAAPPAAPAPKVLGAHTGELVKIASNSAVYFVATDGKRHAFPNEKVYFTWYQNFDDVVTISDAEMAALPLGTNVTYRPGTRMVKFQSLAKVYVVGKGGELRWVGSESLAASLYGAHWAKMVDDVSDAFYVNYHFGADVTEVTGFNPATETAAVPTIDENI